MRTRTEGLDKPMYHDSGTITSRKNGIIVGSVPAPPFQYYPNQRITIDEVHPGWKSGQGGPFDLRSYQSPLNGQMFTTRYSNRYSDTEYKLFRYINFTGLSSRLPPSGLDACASYGPTAFNKFKPSSVKVNLGQFVAELRDAPSLIRFKLKKFKDLGSNYLNYQFGWKPFVSDLRSWYSSIINIDNQLAQVQRNNGREIKRVGNVLKTSSESQYGMSTSLGNPTLCTIINSTCTTHIEEEVWFSGHFRYYVPGLTNGTWGTAPKLAKLWGFEVTPSLIWELLPYSWLVDWFSNIGDVIGNYSAMKSENLAAKNAYVMRHTVTGHSADMNVLGTYIDYSKNIYKNPTIFLSRQCTIETKSRVVASPFGFEFSWPDFTPYQLSILAALGISRS